MRKYGIQIFKFFDNVFNYKFFEQILNSWPMCGTAVGGQAAAKKWTESGEMYKKATVLLYTRLH